MYPKVKKLKQQDLFDNSLSMPFGKKCHAVGLQRLVYWAFVYGVSDVSTRGFVTDCGGKYRLYVKYGNGKRFHSRWIKACMHFDGRYFPEPEVLQIAFRIVNLLYWFGCGERVHMSFMPYLMRRLLKLLKKSRIH